MKVLELHILQSFPVSCLNRDDVGAPKSALFGGASRARVSSQCWKRAIREEAQNLDGSLFAANRTRYIVARLEEALKNKKCPEGKEREYALLLADAIGKADDKKEGAVKTLLFFSPNEFEVIAEAFLTTEGLADLDDKKTKDAAEKARKSVKANDKVKDAADVSIFGRMVADDHSLMVEGAGMFAHAISTHKVSTEIDFFTAVDDVAPEDSEGAGHIGTLEFNSACYYRYIALNLDLLKNSDHLGHFSDEEFKKVVDAFIRASILSVPGARKNSMMSFNPPEYVLGTIREGQPVSLANAFENPVTSTGKGFVAPSIQALEEKFQWMEKTYGFTSIIEKKIPEVGMNEFCEGLGDHV
jgi:CRISPR system Cascade subunit CasC